MGRKLRCWTTVDRRHETLRTGMQDLFHNIDIDIDIDIVAN